MPPGKHIRKRQRTDKTYAQPLGAVASLLDDADKDDEERRLESVLFGKPFVSMSKDDEISGDDEDGPEGLLDDVGREF